MNARDWLMVGMTTALLGACGDADAVPDGGAAAGDAGPAADASIDDAAIDGGPPSIECAEAGSHPEQSFEHGGETRHYFLHVPAGHRCGDPLPMWIDLHGTAGERPEEAYGLAAMTALADREGVLVVRPRSRSSEEGSLGAIYRWDQNPGDLERNEAFIEALAGELARAYPVDPTKLFVSGFSTGSNMTARLLASGLSMPDGTPFTGYGVIAGGAFSPIRIASTTTPPRIYASTGYRDYLHDAHVTLLAEVERAGVPADRVLERESDTGHELYDWQFDEMWAFFATGERAVDGPLADGYSRIDAGTDHSLLSLEVTADGTWVVAGEGPTIVRRTEDGWAPAAAPSGTPAWTGVCTTDGGLTVAVGGGWATTSDDDGATWTSVARVPSFGTAMFSYSFVTDVGCAGDEAIALGYWTAGATNEGTTWTAVPIVFDAGGGTDFPTQNASLARGASGTDVAVGYYFVARRPAGGVFATVPAVSSASWHLDVDEAAPGMWIVVGDHGTILRSIDDGATFVEVASGTRDDLYAVDMRDDGEGMAVGLHGAALHTADGGLTWRDVRPGTVGFFGDVRMLGPGHAVLIGEDGLVLERRAD